MSNKKILIIYINAGMGHEVYSEAIKNCIRKNYNSQYDIKEMDYAKELGLAHGKGREVVVEHESLEGHAAELFHPLLILGCPERGGHDRLSLASREER